MDHSAYKVNAPDPMTGQVTSGDIFSSKGLKGANALNATPSVKPSYEAKATLVLDLRDPIKGDACRPLDPDAAASGAIDPCLWFEMTEKTNDNPAVPSTLADNQHHDGTDWIYGGWDRDVLQADRAQNGPNPGDRLIDWNGAYNLYTHCPASYGGFNDIRQHSPGMQTFLQKLAWGSGAGQTVNDSLTAGTSAFRELALVYPSDNNAHGVGPAYPTTPGHFGSPVSCTD